MKNEVTLTWLPLQEVPEVGYWSYGCEYLRWLITSLMNDVDNQSVTFDRPLHWGTRAHGPTAKSQDVQDMEMVWIWMRHQWSFSSFGHLVIICVHLHHRYLLVSVIMPPPSQTHSQSTQTRAGAETSQPRVMFRFEESRLPRGKTADTTRVSF